MNTQMRHSLVVPIVIFIALAAADAILISTASRIADPLAQITMVTTGSVLFGSGLVFFLTRIVASRDIIASQERK